MIEYLVWSKINHYKFHRKIVSHDRSLHMDLSNIYIYVHIYIICDMGKVSEPEKASYYVEMYLNTLIFILSISRN